MQLVTSFIVNEPSQQASNYFEIRSKAALTKLSSMNVCLRGAWESKLLWFQYYFVGVQFHWLMLMQMISLYRSRPNPQVSVHSSSSVYQDTRYQDFPSIAMSAIRSKTIGQKNTNLVKRTLRSCFLSSFVDFCSVVQRKSQKCLSQSAAGVAILFFQLAKKKNLVEDI